MAPGNIQATKAKGIKTDIIGQPDRAKPCTYPKSTTAKVRALCKPYLEFPIDHVCMKGKSWILLQSVSNG